MNPLDQLADVAVTSILMNKDMHPGLNKLTMDQSYYVADRVSELIEKPLGGVAGYKIAWNSPEQLKKMELAHPGAGRIHGKSVRSSETSLALTDFSNFLFEAEIVAFIGRDITPGTTYNAMDIREYISEFTVGIEVLNRLDGADDASPTASIAHNIYNAGVILGNIQIPPFEMKPDDFTTRVSHNDKVVFEDVARAPQDPYEAIAFLANHFTGRGGTMTEGQLILCGSHIAPYPITAPGKVTVSIGNLGEVSMSVI